jgi:Flp pilus assembly pilin Flp
MLWNFIKDESGQDTIEYSLLLALIAAVAIITLSAVGNNLRELFSKLTLKVGSGGLGH